MKKHNTIQTANEHMASGVVKIFDYTHQVSNPDEFLRFDLTEGICWFQEKINDWLKQIPIGTVIHYPNASIGHQQELLSHWLSIPTDNFVVGNGSDELIELIAQDFLSPGDECVSVVPTFFRFTQASRRAGATVRTVQLRIEDGFAWNQTVTQNLIAEVNRTKVKLVWLASPNNPTGVSIPNEVITQVISTGKIVVLDKVLNGFPSDLRLAGQLIEKHQNVIFLSGFSKTFGLPGLRLGFAIAAPKVIQAIKQRRLPFSSSAISIFLMEELLRALINNEISVPPLQKICKERLWLEKAISHLSNMEVVSSSSTNLILVRSTLGRDLFEDLKQKKVLATDLNDLEGVSGLGLVRIAVRTHSENERLVNILKEMER